MLGVRERVVEKLRIEDSNEWRDNDVFENNTNLPEGDLNI